jgi:hypothetical protein
MGSQNDGNRKTRLGDLRSEPRFPPKSKLNGNVSSALDAVNNGKRKTHCCDLVVEPSFASKSIPALEGYPRMVNVPMHLVDMVFPAQFRQFLDR